MPKSYKSSYLNRTEVFQQQGTTTLATITKIKSCLFHIGRQLFFSQDNDALLILGANAQAFAYGIPPTQGSM